MKKTIDGKKLNLEDYLTILTSKFNLNLVPNNHFPTDEMFKEFLSTIKSRSDEEIKNILRSLIIKNCTFNKDLLYKDAYDKIDWETHKSEEIYQNISTNEYFKRLMAYRKETDTVWEGLTWTLDLLPHFPNEALKGLSSYFLANCQYLPDSYFNAFSDWTAIIRAKYIDVEIPQEMFLNLQPIEFEFIIAELFEKMGYKTEITKPSYDGGIDVIAEKDKIGKKERLFIQCKRHRKNIGVDEPRKLLGVVSNQKATKGTIIACSNFTPEAKKFSNSNPRIELINIKDLTQLLNKHLGTYWSIKTDMIFMNQKQKLKKTVSL